MRVAPTHVCQYVYDRSILVTSAPLRRTRRHFVYFRVTERSASDDHDVRDRLARIRSCSSRQRPAARRLERKKERKRGRKGSRWRAQVKARGREVAGESIERIGIIARSRSVRDTREGESEASSATRKRIVVGRELYRRSSYPRRRSVIGVGIARL